MRKITVFVLLLGLLSIAGIALAHPGDDHPNADVFTAECEGLGTIDVVLTGQAAHAGGGIGIARTIYADGVLIFDHPGKGYETVSCSWTMPSAPGVNFTGDVQIAPPQ